MTAHTKDHLKDLQKLASSKEPGEDLITVRLHLSTGDVDGIRWFDEQLPVSVVRAILDPSIPDFFIPVRGTARMKPPIARGHWLYTLYVSEIILFGDLPEETHP